MRIYLLWNGHSPEYHGLASGLEALRLGERQIQVIVAGGVINYFKMSSGDAMSVISMTDV